MKAGHCNRGCLCQKIFTLPFTRIEIYPLKNDGVDESVIEEQDETGDADTDEKATGEENGTQKDTEDKKPSGEGGEGKTKDGRSDDGLWGNPDEITKK